MKGLYLNTRAVFSEAAMDCSRSNRETSRQKTKGEGGRDENVHFLHLIACTWIKKNAETSATSCFLTVLLCTKGFYTAKDIDI